MPHAADNEGLRLAEGRVGDVFAFLLLETYNIRDGRQEGLYNAACALAEANMDVAVAQEMKIMDLEFATRKWTGYETKVAALVIASWSFELVLNKQERFFVVYCYLAPSDTIGRCQPRRSSEPTGRGFVAVDGAERSGVRDAPLLGATRPSCSGEMDMEAGEVGIYEDGGLSLDPEST